MIVGTGAMGSIYAGLLAEAGHEVWAIDLWQAHLKAIQTQGLRLEGASGDRIINTINEIGSIFNVCKGRYRPILLAKMSLMR